MNEVNRAIDNAFNAFINTHKEGSKNMHGNKFINSLNLSKKNIEFLNVMREQLKINIDLAVGDKLEMEKSK